MEIFAELNNFYERIVWQDAGDNHTVLLKDFAEAVVELEAVAVAFADFRNFAVAEISAGGKSFGRDFARIRAEPHGAALVDNVELAVHQRDNWVFSFWIELGGIGVGETADVACELDNGALHTEAQSEERDFIGAGEINRADFAFDATVAETARD